MWVKRDILGSRLTNSSSVVSSSEQQLWTSIPDRHHDLISLPQRLKRVPTDSRETEISDLDDSSRRNEDVCWFEISMKDVMGMEVEDSVDELMEEGFESGDRKRTSKGLGVVMDNLLGR